MKCPNCNYDLDTTDWTELFTFNDEVFDVQCGHCEESFEVVVDITPQYECVHK